MRLPKKLRTLLASPRGALLKDDSFLWKILKGKKFVTVGDVTTKRCLEAGLRPWTAIFDGKTRRSRWVELEASNGLLKTVNPPGGICFEAASAVKEAVKRGMWVKVEGEEDLLAIPALLSSPDGSLLLYGQPKAGVVLIEANPYTRSHFVHILSKFEGDVELVLRELGYHPDEPLLGELEEGPHDFLVFKP